MKKIYVPYEERTPNNDYKSTLKFVLENGERDKTQLETDALTYIAPPPMRFKVANGFPIITERNITFWKQPIAEICAFINGARTLKTLEDFGCFFWKPWGTKKKCEKRGLCEGDLGPGSYGAAFHDFPMADGNTFNQFNHVVEQIRELPHLRTHYISPWIPQYIGRGQEKQQKVVVAPCHGWIHFRIINNKMTLHMIQRSADLPVGVPSNMVQYAALLLMMAQITGYEPYEYVHSFSDAHIYVDQISVVEEILSRETRPFPTVEIEPSVTDLFAFRKDHFKLSDYSPHPAIKEIPVAI